MGEVKPSHEYACVTGTCKMESVCLHYAENNPGLPAHVICHIGHNVRDIVQEVKKLTEDLKEDFGEGAPLLAILIVMNNLAREVATVGYDVIYLKNAYMRLVLDAQTLPFLNSLTNDDEPEDGGKLH